MMILKTVEMENLGPYYAEHRVDLDPVAGRVTVVHGDNMSGKTSLLNAIRWCLYGIAKDRWGAPMSTKELINYDAFDEGKRRVWVQLTIRDVQEGGESLVKLRRRRQAKQGVDNPRADREFEEYLDVEQDGHVLAAHQFVDVVNDLMPQDIVRFFLFDGELLAEYEELVRAQENVQGRKVKQAVESILGVPAVTRGRDDIAVLQDEAERKFRKEAKKHTAARDAADRLDVVAEERAKAQADRTDMQEQREIAENELRALEEELKNFVELREDVGRLTQLRATSETLEAAFENKKRIRRDLARNLWRDALHPRLRFELDRLEDERGEIAEALGQLVSAQRRVGELQRALEKDTCQMCGQAIPQETLTKLRRDLTDAKKEVAALEPRASRGRADELGATIKRLREVAPAGVSDAVAVVENDQRDNVLARYKVDEEIGQIVSRLHGLNPEAILEYEKKRDLKLTLVANLGSQIEEITGLIAQYDAEIAALKRTIAEHHVPALERLGVEVAILDGLETIFVLAVDEYVNELRKTVESEATNVFKELTTDKTYSRLEINERFGLTIRDATDREVTTRSAGAEQVVALSLIGSLNRLAKKRGPLIMDTPFGRLDPTHRHNILRFLPTLSEQVILLVHGGEVNADDLASVASQIGHEYWIEHFESGKSRFATREPHDG